MFDDMDDDYYEETIPAGSDAELTQNTKSSDGKNAPTTLSSTKQAITASTPWRALMFARKKAGEFSAKYPNAIRHCLTVSETLLNFHKRKTPLSFVRGGFQLAETVFSTQLYNFHQFARAADGFCYLTSNRVNIAFLFKDIVTKFPTEKITFKNNETADCVHLPMGDIYFYVQGETPYIYYNHKQIDKEQLTRFLVDEKFKDLNSNFLYLQTKENEYSLTLSALNPDIKTSVLAKQLAAKLTRFNKAGINRSLFLYGVAGTGKTSAAYSILSSMNYRTIVFSASNKLCTFDVIRNLIDLLGIDSIVIDDFDQLSSTNKTLDMLEMFNKKLKVLIGVANSLKDFHPATLRPGRFDTLLLVDQLDDGCISSVLGDLAETYMPLVRKWPIAYIAELAKNKAFMTDTELKAYAEELNQRVKKQVGLFAAGRWAIENPMPQGQDIQDGQPKSFPKKLNGVDITYMSNDLLTNLRDGDVNGDYDNDEEALDLATALMDMSDTEFEELLSELNTFQQATFKPMPIPVKKAPETTSASATLSI